MDSVVAERFKVGRGLGESISSISKKTKAVPLRCRHCRFREGFWQSIASLPRSTLDFIPLIWFFLAWTLLPLRPIRCRTSSLQRKGRRRVGSGMGRTRVPCRSETVPQRAVQFLDIRCSRSVRGRVNRWISAPWTLGRVPRSFDFSGNAAAMVWDMRLRLTGQSTRKAGRRDRPDDGCGHGCRPSGLDLC
jgi:hypothetical protein